MKARFPQVGRMAGATAAFRTMKKLHLLIAAGGVLLSFVAIVSQGLRIQALKSELASRASGAPSGDRVTDAVGSDALSGKSGGRLPEGENDSATGAEAPRGSGDAEGPPSLRRIMDEPNPMTRIRALLAYADRLRPDQFEAALDELRLTAPDWDSEGKMLTHILLTRWAEVDPDAAFASLDRLEFRNNGGDAASVLASLAANDPARAARWLANPDNALAAFPKMGHVLAGTVAKEWVRQDPDAALTWARSLPDSQQLGALTGIFGPLATVDPKNAAELAAQLEPGDSRRHVLGEIAGLWGRQAPGRALAWAETLAADDRQVALGRVLGAWAQTSPAEAATYLDAAPSDPANDKHLGAVAEAWALQAPSEAAQWIAARPDSAGKNDVMGRVLWNWTNIDPQAASLWLAEQPAGPTRDGGITGLAKAVFDTDPNAALTWASEISNPEIRAKATEIGLQEWIKRDPDAAAEWIERHEKAAAE